MADRLHRQNRHGGHEGRRDSHEFRCRSSSLIFNDASACCECQTTKVDGGVVAFFIGHYPCRFASLPSRPRFTHIFQWLRRARAGAGVRLRNPQTALVRDQRIFTIVLAVFTNAEIFQRGLLFQIFQAVLNRLVLVFSRPNLTSIREVIARRLPARSPHRELRARVRLRAC